MSQCVNWSKVSASPVLVSEDFFGFARGPEAGSVKFMAAVMKNIHSGPATHEWKEICQIFKSHEHVPQLHPPHLSYEMLQG